MRFHDEFEKVPIPDKYEIFDRTDENPDEPDEPDEIIDLRDLGQHEKNYGKSATTIGSICIGLFSLLYLTTVVVYLTYATINRDTGMLKSIFNVMHYSFVAIIMTIFCRNGNGTLGKLWRKLMEKILTG